MKLLALLAALGSTAWCAGGPRLVFTKSFPGSIPAYVWIAVEKSGATFYKETPDDDPETFQMEPDVTAAIFELAGKLDHFKTTIESGLKVANMGAKTFRWEDGADASEAKFNYSSDENARLLLDWFERTSESERVFLELRRAIRYDKLGVHQSLIRIQNMWEQKRLVGSSQFVPLFDRIAKDEAFLHMARERAAQLGDAVRAREKGGWDKGKAE